MTLLELTNECTAQYSYFMPVCSIVKTITPRCRGRPDALFIAQGRRPSAIVHQVVHGTEG